MPRLLIHKHAEADLEGLWIEAPAAAARLTVLLEQIAADPDITDRLTQHDFGAAGTADFHVSKWVEHWYKGKDLWRIKCWDLERQHLRYRVVYAYVPGEQAYYVLAVCPRDWDYAADHELTKRILGDYAKL